MNVGMIIKDYRDKNNLTMDAFAKRAFLSKGFISMLEKNKNPITKKPILPSLDKLKNIAEAMYMPLNTLIELIDSEQKIYLKNTNLEKDNHYQNQNSLNEKECIYKFTQLSQESKKRVSTVINFEYELEIEKTNNRI